MYIYVCAILGNNEFIQIIATGTHSPIRVALIMDNVYLITVWGKTFERESFHSFHKNFTQSQFFSCECESQPC